MDRRMFINAQEPEECRIAILQDGILDEFYVESALKESLVGNIYKGRVVNVISSLQAAFVDYGAEKNGFIHITDVVGAEMESDPGEHLPEPPRSPSASARNTSAPEASGTSTDSVPAEAAPDSETSPLEAPPDEMTSDTSSDAESAEDGGEMPSSEAMNDPVGGDVDEVSPSEMAPPRNGSDEETSGADDAASSGTSAAPVERGQKRASGGRGRDRGRQHRGPHRPRPRLRPIQEVLRVGQEVIVQVTRDGMGQKGPTFTMNVSIPGRYLVLTPYENKVGVSRKIDNWDTRSDLRRLLAELHPPEGIGFIIRTAGAERSKEDLAGDLDHLARLWNMVDERSRTTPAPCALYQESDLVIRTVRDMFTPDVREILVDSPVVHQRLSDFFMSVMPRYRSRLQLYHEPEPVFYRHNIEKQIRLIYERRVDLPSGGSIVIEQTEALVAIDVNSGRLVRDLSPEELACQTNREAATEIARQLRLRDLGGVIVIDFIDMREARHRVEIERLLHNFVSRDRAQTRILRTSRFGVIEMARQKMGSGVKALSYEKCPQCRSAGQIRTTESMALQVLRQIRLNASRREPGSVEIRLHPDVASYLLNVKRRNLVEIEMQSARAIIIKGQKEFWAEQVEISNGPPMMLSPLQIGTVSTPGSFAGSGMTISGPVVPGATASQVSMPSTAAFVPDIDATVIPSYGPAEVAPPEGSGASAAVGARTRPPVGEEAGRRRRRGGRGRQRAGPASGGTPQAGRRPGSRGKPKPVSSEGARPSAGSSAEGPEVGADAVVPAGDAGGTSAEAKSPGASAGEPGHKKRRRGRRGGRRHRRKGGTSAPGANGNGSGEAASSGASEGPAPV